MVPLALGSQTVGSVLRPAAYCGVVGLKPTHGRISAAGVLELAGSLDHVGVFARAVEDCALALAVLAGGDPAPDDYVGAVVDPAAPRLGALAPFLARATPEMGKHLEAVTRGLAAAGALLEDVTLPAAFASIYDVGATVLRAEAAAAHAPLFPAHAAEYPPKIKELIELGHAISAPVYLAAQAARRQVREAVGAIAARYDAFLLPTIGAPAPRGLGSTGDPSFCSPWSFLGMPAITLPTGVEGGLPLAIQLVAAPWSEARLLAAAAWCERAIGFAAGPPL
jgi:amidase